ncbi:hypothetical protein D3C81_1352390 [compost metagenome]
MGVEPADQDARIGDAELVAQVGMQDARDSLQAIRGDGIGHLAQGQVSGDQRDAQSAGGQHHHHLRGRGQFREEFGMPGEGDAALVDHALVHRRGDHSGEVAVQAALAGAGEGFQHIAGIRRVQLAALHRSGQWCIPHVQAAGLRGLLWPVARSDRQQADRQAQQCGALGQQRLAGDGHQRVRLRLTGQQQTQIGTDAGRFAGSQREDSGVVHEADLWGKQPAGWLSPEMSGGGLTVRRAPGG